MRRTAHHDKVGTKGLFLAVYTAIQFMSFFTSLKTAKQLYGLGKTTVFCTVRTEL